METFKVKVMLILLTVFAMSLAGTGSRASNPVKVQRQNGIAGEVSFSISTGMNGL